MLYKADQTSTVSAWMKMVVIYKKTKKPNLFEILFGLYTQISLKFKFYWFNQISPVSTGLKNLKSLEN